MLAGAGDLPADCFCAFTTRSPAQNGINPVPSKAKTEAATLDKFLVVWGILLVDPLNF